MKPISFFIVSLLLFLSTSYSAVIPDWVKKGLVVVYYSEGGSGTGLGTTQGSAVSGSGYRVFIVLSKTANEVYGMDITLLSSPVSGTFFASRIAKLGEANRGGLFFVDPKDMNRRVLRKEAPTNCVIHGNPGTFALECSTGQSTSKTMIIYDQKTGLVKEFTMMEIDQGIRGRSSTVAKGKYMKHFYIKLPDVRNLPQEALKSRTYRMIDNMMGFPLGSVYINFTGAKNGVAHYQINMSGAPVSMKTIGLTLIGPHYIHPSLLKQNVILNIPEINFQIAKGGMGYKGGVVIQFIWNGNVVLQQEYDPNTGLKLYEINPQFMGGSSMSFELSQ